MGVHDDDDGEDERRSSYRRSRDLEARRFEAEIQRNAEMLVRHEREIAQIREAETVTRSLLVGVDGHGGLLDEIESLDRAVQGVNQTLSHIDVSVSDRIDSIRRWAVGVVFTFALGAGAIVAAIATHH